MDKTALSVHRKIFIKINLLVSNNLSISNVNNNFLINKINYK
jgi:hypothetical protein